jgi:hypothetical protein
MTFVYLVIRNNWKGSSWAQSHCSTGIFRGGLRTIQSRGLSNTASTSEYGRRCILSLNSRLSDVFWAYILTSVLGCLAFVQLMREECPVVRRREIFTASKSNCGLFLFRTRALKSNVGMGKCSLPTQFSGTVLYDDCEQLNAYCRLSGCWFDIWSCMLLAHHQLLSRSFNLPLLSHPAVALSSPDFLPLYSCCYLLSSLNTIRAARNKIALGSAKALPEWSFYFMFVF